ncbi:MAG: sigma-70 family RNA polymerase sigma factor [Planctomycetota bacterium]
MNSADVTSWSLILGAAAGKAIDREAFARLYGPVIRSYLAARWHLSFEDAAVVDGTSDVFVECFKGGGALERVDSQRPGGFRAFLYGVVRNVALMTERKLARRRERGTQGSLDFDALPDAEDTLSRVFDRAWAEAVVREARARMAQRAQRSPAASRRLQTLTMRFEQGLAPRHIAAANEVPVERVYELLREARTEFRATLLEVMATYHPNSTEAEVERLCVDLLASLR